MRTFFTYFDPKTFTTVPNHLGRRYKWDEFNKVWITTDPMNLPTYLVTGRSRYAG